MKSKIATYKINITEINEIVSECVKKILLERISAISYHFTSLYSCINILKNNEFRLTLSSNYSDSYDKKRLFYLSTQRSANKDLGYANKLGSCVRIQLDGDIINQNYHGKPIDYWKDKQLYYSHDYESCYGKGFSNSKKYHTSFEMEDRIFSYNPTIENASKYIKRIDVLLSDMRKDLIDRERDEAITIYMLCRRDGINANIYNNLKDFNFMTDNNINDEIKKEYDDGNIYINTNFTNSERYKISHEIFSKNHQYITILEHLFNILTDGKIYNKSQEIYSFIADTLEKFGLKQYITPLIKQLQKSYGTNYKESASLLSNTVNAPIRRLNHDFPDDEDSNRIMKFGSYVLKNKNASNFDEISWR